MNRAWIKDEQYFSKTARHPEIGYRQRKQGISLGITGKTSPPPFSTH